ncbi:MAG: F-box-like domain-containing protein [Kistimonas sp.]|nr:F-box-like domain-containing protein [Kistimonas sp.]
MDQLSNAGVAHRNFPQHRPADKPDRTEMAQPGHPVGARSCITASTPGGGTHRGLPGNQNTTAVLSRAQTLPLVVLEKICSYLPLLAQSQCAQVCRHWHDCLPAPRLRLAQWLQKNAPLSYLANVNPGRSFSNRALPFLQAAHSPLLPTLMHLHQEQQDQERAQAQRDTQPRAAGPAACHLLSAMVHQGLKEHLTRADQINLHPAAIDWPDATPVEAFGFSPCSRWLAMRCQLQGEGPAVLRLYGWEKDFWQQQTLKPYGAEPVTGFMFASEPQATLFSNHGKDILAWRREPGTNNWHHTRLYRLPPSNTVEALFPMSNGDLVTLVSCSLPEPGLRVLFSVYTGDDRGWQETTGKKYGECPKIPQSYTADQRSCKVVLNWGSRTQDIDSCVTDIHIWRKGLEPARPQAWAPQALELRHGHARMRWLVCTPGGRCLLGVLTNGQAYMWTLDATYQMQRQLSSPDYLSQLHLPFSFKVSFRDDGRQLAFPCSPHQIQLCYSNSRGHWQCTQRLEPPSDPEIPADDSLEHLLLSSSGRMLLRTTQWRLDVWHQSAGGDWQHRLEHKRTQPALFWLQARLLPFAEQVYTLTADPQRYLSIHGPDSRGQFVRKARVPVNALIGGLSPDGLSLLMASRGHPPTLLQLHVQTQEETGGRAQEALPQDESVAQEQQEQQEQQG